MGTSRSDLTQIREFAINGVYITDTLPVLSRFVGKKKGATVEIEIDS